MCKAASVVRSNGSHVVQPGMFCASVGMCMTNPHEQTSTLNPKTYDLSPILYEPATKLEFASARRLLLTLLLHTFMPSLLITARMLLP